MNNNNTQTWLQNHMNQVLRCVTKKPKDYPVRDMLKSVVTRCYSILQPQKDFHTNQKSMKSYCKYKIVEKNGNDGVRVNLSSPGFIRSKIVRNIVIT